MNPKLKSHIGKYFSRVLPTVDHIEGDYVELGFGRGNSAELILSKMERGIIKKRDLWFFDSFEGFPEPTVEDEGPRNPKKGQWRVPYGKVQKLRDSYPEMSIKDVKGFFSETVPQCYTGNKIAILHLDCDLYESYIEGFRLIDKVVSGGIIMFDEYQEDRWRGATVAIDEYFNEDTLRFYGTDTENPKCYYIKP